jgi:hypothetical protein
VDHFQYQSPTVPQFYATTIQGEHQDSTVYMLAVPTRSLPEFVRCSDDGSPAPGLIADCLGLKELSTLRDDQMVDAVGGILLYAADAEHHRHASPIDYLTDRVNFHVPRRGTLANYLVEANVLPFEQSPLQGLSLQEIAKTSGTALGAYIGYMSAAGDVPLLLITVPAGMVIVGAASGLAHGLEEGIRRRITKLLADKSEGGKRPRASVEKE